MIKLSQIKITDLHSIMLMLVIVVFSSCSDDPDRPITRVERNQMDSILVDHRKQWLTFYDSTCTVKLDSMVQFYFDSLIQKEYEAIKILER